jgi:sulfur-carrier protein adenylyltransferase/sulfurtransferase
MDAMTRTQTFWNCFYWLDLGNNADSGQFVLGQPENSRTKSVELRLPIAAELFPELIDPRLDRRDTLPSCSAPESLERQEPFCEPNACPNRRWRMLARLFRYGRLP